MIGYPMIAPVGLDIVRRPTLDSLRAVVAATVSTVRQASPTRIVITATAALALVAVALFVPLPTALQLRDWATSLGPWFPVAFLAAHAIVTVFPFPRTAFTLASGLLFGPLLGVVIAVTASTASALLALLLVRAAGWQLNRLGTHPALESIDERLQVRGWAAVLSLRLIPAVPFSVLNYAAGASAVRVWPYLAATFVGVLPGTAAVVVLGDALTGRFSPLLMVVSLCTATVGIAGLVYEFRGLRRRTDGAGG